MMQSYRPASTHKGDCYGEQIELEPAGIKVNAVSPGYTKTNLNNYAGTETVEEGAAEAVRVALLGPDGPTGTFTHAKFGTLPW
jgi:NAD(P)-dependent dehydrogenase (short-subunit alcohol dehydrogenase family)